MPQVVWNVLQTNNLFVTPWADIHERYTIKPYIDIEVERNEIMAILDKNIISYVTGLIRADPKIVNDDKSREIACAVMYFLIFNNIKSEPSYAYHEYAYTNNSNSIANENLKLFRIADNANPEVYLKMLDEKNTLLKYRKTIMKKLKVIIF